jgi:ABC-2 type transport system permease protein
VRFGGALFATNLKASLMLRGTFVIQMLFMMLNNVTFFTFWWVLMQRVDQIRGWRLEDVQVLFGVVAAGFGLAVSVCGGVRQIGRLIDQGELDTLLVQPKPVLLYAIGLRSQASGFGDVLSGLAFLAWSGRVTWANSIFVVVAVLASALIFVASGVVFFSLPFWLGKVDMLARQLWDLTITFAVYPEPLFGGTLRLVLFTVVPAGFVGYLPARLIRDPSAPTMLLLIGAALVYITAAAVLFNRGLRRYASGSRFATFG